MEAMQQLLEQPLAVAFATAPLGEEQQKQKGVRREGSSSSENTDIEEPMTTRFARKMGISRGSKSRIFGNDAAAASAGPSKLQNVDFGEEFDEDVFANESEYLPMLQTSGLNLRQVPQMMNSQNHSVWSLGAPSPLQSHSKERILLSKTKY